MLKHFREDSRQRLQMSVHFWLNTSWQLHDQRGHHKSHPNDKTLGHKGKFIHPGSVNIDWVGAPRHETIFLQHSGIYLCQSSSERRYGWHKKLGWISPPPKKRNILPPTPPSRGHPLRRCATHTPNSSDTGPPRRVATENNPLWTGERFNFNICNVHRESVNQTRSKPWKLDHPQTRSSTPFFSVSQRILGLRASKPLVSLRGETASKGGRTPVFKRGWDTISSWDATTTISGNC